LLGRGFILVWPTTGRLHKGVLDERYQFEPARERDRLAVLVAEATLNRVACELDLQREAELTSGHARWTFVGVRGRRDGDDPVLPPRFSGRVLACQVRRLVAGQRLA
jgi:hypothetical protein